jgi:hypothetical protein
VHNSFGGACWWSPGFSRILAPSSLSSSTVSLAICPVITPLVSNTDPISLAQSNGKATKFSCTFWWLQVRRECLILVHRTSAKELSNTFRSVWAIVKIDLKGYSAVALSIVAAELNFVCRHMAYVGALSSRRQVARLQRLSLL